MARLRQTSLGADIEDLIVRLYEIGSGSGIQLRAAHGAGVVAARAARGAYGR